MNRFQRELNGDFGELIKQGALAEVEKKVKKANEQALVNSDGAIYWKSNGRYLMDDYCEALEYANYNFSREATRIAREEQVKQELEEYRQNHSQYTLEEQNELDSNFPEGTIVVDIISGRKYITK